MLKLEVESIHFSVIFNEYGVVLFETLYGGKQTTFSLTLLRVNGKIECKGLATPNRKIKETEEIRTYILNEYKEEIANAIKQHDLWRIPIMFSSIK